MFPFRVEHFLPPASYFTWHSLPPVVLQIRALRMRLDSYLHRPLTTEIIAQCREAWHVLSQVEINGKRVHYWPYPYLTPDRLASPDCNGMRDPRTSGGDVTMMSAFFDHVEEFVQENEAKATGNGSYGPFPDELERMMTNLDEPCAITAAGLAAAMAWIKLADAEEGLLSRKAPDDWVPVAGADACVEAAWLAVQEATMLIDEARYLRRLAGVGFSQLPVPEGVLRGIYHYDGERLTIDLRAHANDVPEPSERFEITVGNTGPIDGFRLWAILLSASPAAVDWGQIDIPYTRNEYEFIVPKPFMAETDAERYKKENMKRHPVVPPDGIASTRAIGEALRQAAEVIRETSELAAAHLQNGLSIQCPHTARFQSDRVVWTVPCIHGHRR